MSLTFPANARARSAYAGSVCRSSPYSFIPEPQRRIDGDDVHAGPFELADRLARERLPALPLAFVHQRQPQHRWAFWITTSDLVAVAPDRGGGTW